MNSQVKVPYVSIGLPVYNGQAFIEAAVDSLLNQTFGDFELIICDNASTDNTEKICQAYASKDKRVRYYRNPRNLGAPMNYNRTVKLSRAKYFKWAAADDMHAPEYLEKCVKVLDNDPSVVLCHSKMDKIDENGKVTGTYDHTMKVDSTNVVERFRDLISLKTNICFQIFGIMRSEVLLKTPLHGDYRGADANLLAELSLYGRIYEIPHYLFSRRDHSGSYTRKFCSDDKKKSNYLKAQKAWWTGKSWLYYTNWKNFCEFFYSVDRAPLKLKEKLLCYAEIYRWVFREGWKLFGNDIDQYFLCRFSFEPSAVKVVKKAMRYLGIKIIQKDI
jgi:glycosyltransferase involved in cell wall biosynthesis